MQDVANAAGVCKATVSLALRDDQRLPESTRKRIQEIAHDLGYRRNPVVDSLMTQLRSARTSSYQATLGLVNCSSEKNLYKNHTFREFRNGVRTRANQLGYKVEDYWLEEPGLRPERLKQILSTRNIRGLVLIATLTPHMIHERYRDFWNNYACAIVGVTHVEKRLPCATNDQYFTAKYATEKLLGMGYSRPGLAVDHLVDDLLDNKFTAGYLTATRALPKKDRIELFPLSTTNRAEFNEWVSSSKPDVIITNEEIVREWLEEGGQQIPKDIGIIHLDWYQDIKGWAGMLQNNQLVASAATDLVISQLQKNEYGPQPNPKVVVLESDWVDGESIKVQARAKKPRHRQTQKA